MLVFQVYLFPARGERPRDLEEAWSREKEIRYSSRTRRISDQLVRRGNEHRLNEKMLAQLPAAAGELSQVKAVQRVVRRQALHGVQLHRRPPVLQTGSWEVPFSRCAITRNQRP